MNIVPALILTRNPKTVYIAMPPSIWETWNNDTTEINKHVLLPDMIVKTNSSKDLPH